MEKKSLYANFYYSKDDEDLIQELCDYLADNAEKIFEFFDSSLPREVVKIKIMSKAKYDDIVMKRRKTSEIPKWEIGNCNDDVIEYVSLHDYKNTSHAFPEDEYKVKLEEYKKTIIHEYVHFVTYLYWKKYKMDAPLTYLNEGIAQYLSGQREYIDFNFKYSLDNILNSNNCYIGWYLLTKYIIKAYSKEYFFKLFESAKYAEAETPRLYEEAKKYYNGE